MGCRAGRRRRDWTRRDGRRGPASPFRRNMRAARCTRAMEGWQRATRDTDRRALVEFVARTGRSKNLGGTEGYSPFVPPSHRPRVYHPVRWSSSEPVGYLAVGLVDALWRRFAAGRPGKLDHLDLEAAVPAAVKSCLQEPIRAERHTITLPVFDPAHLESFA